MKRTAFFISDSTGITAETLGAALLSQFPQIDFSRITIPYINSEDKAREVVTQINKATRKDQAKALVFSSLAKPEIRSLIADCNCMFIDFFDILVGPLETELQSKYVQEVGKFHKIPDSKTYEARIAAIDFALSTDDGVGIKNYKSAEIILIGVSRSGKTPTCIYLALKYGIRAANYPITEEDITVLALPEVLRPYRKKIFGLTIGAERLHEIREQRKPNSTYASLPQCQKEFRYIEQMFKNEHIPYLESTDFSIEEIATQIITKTPIKRHVF